VRTGGGYEGVRISKGRETWDIEGESLTWKEGESFRVKRMYIDQPPETQSPRFAEIGKSALRGIVLGEGGGKRWDPGGGGEEKKRCRTGKGI